MCLCYNRIAIHANRTHKTNTKKYFSDILAFTNLKTKRIKKDTFDGILYAKILIFYAVNNTRLLDTDRLSPIVYLSLIGEVAKYSLYTEKKSSQTLALLGLIKTNRNCCFFCMFLPWLH